MYSYDEDNEPKDIMLLDLQTFRYFFFKIILFVYNSHTYTNSNTHII